MRRWAARTERKPRLLTRWKLSQAPAFLRGASSWPCADATAAATSMIPYPRRGLHLPPPEAVAFRIVVTSCAFSEGFVVYTSVAALATSGVENDVPLDQP